MAQRDGAQFSGELHDVGKLVEVSGGVSAGGQHKDERDGGRRLLEDCGQVRGLEEEQEKEDREQEKDEEEKGGSGRPEEMKGGLEREKAKEGNLWRMRKGRREGDTREGRDGRAGRGGGEVVDGQER